MGTGLNLQSVIPDRKYVCDFFARSREERAKDTWVMPFLMGNKVVALNWNKLPSVSAKCTWELLLLPAVWPFRGVGCSRWVMPGFRNWDTVHSTGPFILLLWSWGGQRAPTRSRKMLLTGSWCFFEEWNYTKGEKKGDLLPWGRRNVEVLKGWSWCPEVEKEICFRSSSVWVWGLCVAFPALWKEFCSTLTTLPLLEDFLHQYLGEQKSFSAIKFT